MNLRLYGSASLHKSLRGLKPAGLLFGIQIDGLTFLL